MATKKNKNNTVNLDFDLDGDLDFEGFDFNAPMVKDDRKPIIRAAAAAAKGAVKAPRDSAFLKRTLKDALPKGYGQSWDTADKVTGSLRNLYDESAKEIKPALRESKRVIGKLIPRESKLVPKAVTNLLKRWDEQERQAQRDTPAGLREERESGISSQMSDIFRIQMQHTVETEANREGRDRLKEGIELTRHRELSDLAYRQTVSLDKLQKYQSSVTLGYQKKSLELQFRHLFALQDILGFIKEDASKRDSFLAAIAKNSSLPDAIKVNSKEAREAMSRNKFNESLHKGIFGGRDQLVEKTLGRVSGMVMDQMRGLAGGLQAGASMADTAQSLGEGMPIDKYTVGGEAVGELLGQGAARWGMGKVKKGLNSGRMDRFGGKKVLSAGLKLENMNENMAQRMNAFRKSDKYLFDDSMKGGAMRFLQSILPGMGPETGIRSDGAKDMDSPAGFTKRTNKSINEVIPGYLSRILREVQVLRTGNSNIELTSYNYASSRFTSKGKAEAQVFKEIINGKAAKRTNAQLDQLINQIDPEGRLSNEARGALKKKLLTNSANLDEANRDNLAMYGSYSGTPDKIADEIVPVMRQFFDNMSDEKRVEFSRANNSLAGSIADPREAIQRQADWGNMPYLKRMGFVDGSGKNVDMAKIIDYILDPSNADGVQALAEAGNGKSPGGSAFQSMGRTLAPKTSLKDSFKSGTASVMAGVNKFSSMTPQQMAQATKSYGLSMGDKLKGMIADVYVAGESSPRLLAAKMQAGAYRDRVTKKIISTLNDIQGPVEDTLANNAVVLEAKDLMKLTFMSPASETFEKVKVSVKDATAQATSGLGVPTNIGDLTAAIKRKGQETLAAAKASVADVYVEGESSPRMLAAKMQAGAYTDSETGEAIRHQSEINGDVQDEDGQVVIQGDELPKLRVWDASARRFGPIRFLGRMAMGLAKGLWWLQKKNTKWAMWNLRQLKKATMFTGRVLKSALGFGPKTPKDVFVQGEAEPRLYAARFKAGDYRDQETGERIYHHSDIQGPVIDRDDQVVLAADDLDRLQVYDNILKVLNPLRLVKWLAKTAGKGAWWLVKKWQTKVAPAITKLALKGLGKVGKGIIDFLSKAGEVFVKGESTPRLLEPLMKAGRYFVAKTGKLIAKLSDIDGAVVDENGTTLITEDEYIRGLTRRDGTPIRGGVGGAIGKGFAALNRLMSVRVKLPTGQREQSTSAILKSKAASAGDKTVVLLQDIKAIFEKKFGDRDGDGLRDGSWQSQLKNRASGAKQTISEAAKAAGGGGGLLAGLKSLFGKKKQDEEEDDGFGAMDALDAASDADDLLDRRGRRGRAGRGRMGRLGRLGKYAKYGKGLAAGAAMGAVAYGTDGLLGKLGAGGNKLNSAQDDANWEQMNAWEKTQSGLARGIEKVGDFAFMGNMANSAAKSRIDDETAYMQDKAAGRPGKGLLDYLSMTSPLGLVMGMGGLFGSSAKTTAYDDIRYVQYGFAPTNKDAREKASALEDYLMGLVKDGDTVSLDEAKMDVAKVVTPWGFDPKNTKQLEVFFGWYQKRFKPVFLTHLNAAKKFTGKADLRNVSAIKKENAGAYIEAIRFAGGPYDYTTLPSPSQAWAPTTKYAVDVAIEKAIKDLGAKKVEATGTATVGAAIAGASVAASVGADGKATASADFSATGLGGTQTRLPGVSVSASASTSKDMFFQPKNASAFLAIRMKVYGLADMEAMKVQSLRALENALAKEVKYGGDGNAVWDGNAMDALTKVQGAFGIGDLMGKEAYDWTVWFKNRFLPAYLTFLTGYRSHTGKDDFVNAEYTLKPDQKLQVAQLLIGLSGIWSQTASPWPGYRLATDSKGTEANVEFLAQEAKAVKLEEAKASKGSDAAKSEGSLWERSKTAVKNFFTPTKSEQNKLPAVTSPDAEAPATGTAGISPVAAVGGGNKGIPALAGGDLADGRNGMASVSLKNGVTLDGMHPSFMKNFTGMAEEYGKLTGKKININDAFRSYEDQVAAKKKYGARAASPGSSLHEFGLAMDIDTKTLDELDKMGLMRKYGFTRPVGGEGWHMEPIGIQADIAKFKKDKAAADAAIASGVGRGGGGFGTIAGAPKYSRNRDLAMSIYQSGGAPTVDNTKKDASGQPLAPNDPAATASVGSSVNTAGAGGAMSSGPKLGVDGGYSASADGEAKPQGGGGGAAAGASGLAQRPSTMPADPSVKVPDAKGSGYAGLKDTIEAAAKMVGVDPDTMVRLAAVESSFNPSAQASGSSASGLFQFTKDTWRAMIDKYGRKYGYDSRTPPTDPKAAAIMAAHMLKDSAKFVAGKVKRAFGATEAYMTHFLGQGGAVTFLQALEQNPSAIAADILPRAAKANQDIFYEGGRAKTLQEVYASLDNKVNTKLASFGVPNVAKSNAALASAAPAQSNSASASVPPAPPSGAMNTSAASNAAPVAPVTDQSGSPLTDAYGFKPMQATTRVAPQGQPNQLDASLFGPTNDILSQQLEVQKKMLDTLTSMFGLMGKGGSLTAASATPTEPAASKSDYTVPKAPVQMKRISA